MSSRDDDGLIGLLLAAFGLGGAWLTLAKKANATQDAETGEYVVTHNNPRTVFDQGNITLDDIFRKYGQKYGVDWRLLKGLAQVESSMSPSAKNPADPSYGLMQVLCVSDGQERRCTNKLNVEGWNEATPQRLFDPDFNVRIASQIIAWNIRTYGVPKGIAVYNNWSARNDPPNGPFRNQSYVDKVRAAWVGFGGDGFTNVVAT